MPACFSDVASVRLQSDRNQRDSGQFCTGNRPGNTGIRKKNTSLTPQEELEKLSLTPQTTQCPICGGTDLKVTLASSEVQKGACVHRSVSTISMGKIMSARWTFVYVTFAYRALIPKTPGTEIAMMSRLVPAPSVMAISEIPVLNCDHLTKQSKYAITKRQNFAGGSAFYRKARN